MYIYIYIYIHIYICIYIYIYIYIYICIYRVSSDKHRASNKCRPLISTALLGDHIEINAAPLNAVLIRMVTIFYY